MIELCGDVTHTSRKAFGFLLGLVDERELSLIGWFGKPGIALFEPGYFDIDFRSESSVAIEQTPHFYVFTAVRVHFFRLASHKEKYSSVRDFLKERKKRDYLGYTIYRPTNHHPIGRSLITPAEVLEVVQIEGSDREKVQPVAAEWAATTARLCYTAVKEPIQVYGVPLKARGLPYMSQDGHVLRCAHVSIWICQFTLFLRGMSPRQTTGAIHKHGAVLAKLGRSYPSDGLTDDDISGVLRRLGIPPEIHQQGDLISPRMLTWADRQDMRNTQATYQKAVEAAEGEYQSAVDALHAKLEGAAESVDFAPEVAKHQIANSRRDYARDSLARFWAREKLTSALCRYLNSGIPSILVRHRPYRDGQPVVSTPLFGSSHTHTVVAVGYLRAKPSPTTDVGVSTILVSDDGVGALVAVQVDDLVEEVLEGTLTVYTPRPSAVWLSGAVAESTTISMISELITSAAQRINGLEARIADFSERLSIETESTLTVRTYLSSGVDFKEDFERRFPDKRTNDLLGEASLPKYLWISEVVERTPENPKRPVLATVALDATQPEIDGHSLVSHAPAFVHIPGAATASRFDKDGLPMDAEDVWIPSFDGHYRAGPWACPGARGNLRYGLKLAANGPDM